jgi:hypothetical protein
MSKKGTQLSPALTAARDELQNMLAGKEAAGLGPPLLMEDKLQVIDRLIKIEALEHKMGTGKAGSAFDEDIEGPQ